MNRHPILTTVIEFMFATMMLIGAGRVGYEIRTWEESITIVPRLSEARDKVIEYQEKLKAKGKVSIIEYQKVWIECQ